MLLFVSTRATQGAKTGDFCFVPDGEIVVSYSCPCSDKQCSATCLMGVDSLKSTTTFEVKEFDYTEAEFKEIVRAALLRTALGSIFDLSKPSDEATLMRDVNAVVRELTKALKDATPGQVHEKGPYGIVPREGTVPAEA